MSTLASIQTSPFTFGVVLYVLISYKGKNAFEG